jgi:hypothetical protein
MIEEAKDILSEMYLKKYLEVKKEGNEKYIKISELELINFCTKLLNVLEKNTGEDIDEW